MRTGKVSFDGDHRDTRYVTYRAVLFGLFRNRNTQNRRNSCSLGKYSVYESIPFGIIIRGIALFWKAFWFIVGSLGKILCNVYS